MITYLRIRSLAIVDDLALEPGPGLNVLTGETGAGKSLLIDSLSFLSGERGATSMIRTGDERMASEAVVQASADLCELLREMGVDIEGDHPDLNIRRELQAGGRGRVLINGSPVSVRQLSTVMERLLEIHGQDESHGRIAGQNFRELLDLYAQNEERLGATREAYAAWQQAADRARGLAEAARDRELRLDLLKYQIDEISAARIDPEEEESLREERARLANAQEMIEATAAAFDLVSESEESALVLTARAQTHIHPLSRLVAEMKSVHQDLEDVRIRLQEVSRTLAGLADSIRHDPQRLEEIEDRLATLEKLKKKYGATLTEVLQHLATIQTEYDTLSEAESNLAKLEAEEQSAFRRYETAARALSRARADAVAPLQRAVERELKDLAMERTAMTIRVDRASESGSRLVIDGEPVAFGPEGWDRIEILIAPNLGEEPRPMQKIASGGELSRIQLAIATAVFKASERAGAATLVFDEIDAGIGGRVADAVGAKLCELARTNQVLCVTHLPQIASLGSTHFRVWKEDHKGRTRARVQRLDDPASRVEEIARMLGGETVAESARAHARELLESRTPPSRPARKRAASRAVS